MTANSPTFSWPNSSMPQQIWTLSWHLVFRYAFPMSADSRSRSFRSFSSFSAAIKKISRILSRDATVEKVANAGTSLFLWPPATRQAFLVMSSLKSKIIWLDSYTKIHWIYNFWRTYIILCIYQWKSWYYIKECMIYLTKILQHEFHNWKLFSINLIHDEKKHQKWFFHLEFRCEWTQQPKGCYSCMLCWVD